jgi:hypothetical protein
MTGGANLDQEVFAERRTRRELITTTAGNFDICVVGMDVGFHCLSPAHSSVRKGRVIYSEAAIAASPSRGAKIYPQILWITLWRKIERVT